MWQPLHAVSSSFQNVAQHASTLVTATGALLATVGTSTCNLRRGRNMDDTDRDAAVIAVASGVARRAETALDDVEAQPVKVEPTSDSEGGEESSTPVPDLVPDLPAAVIHEGTLALEGEVVTIAVPAEAPVIRPAPSAISSTGSFRSARTSLGSSFSSTASVRTLLESTPVRGYIIRRMEETEFEDNVFGDLSGSSDSEDETD